MNQAEIDLVIGEIRSLVGARLDGAWQPARDRVIIGLGGERILLVPRGDGARLHRVAQRIANPPRPFSFQGALRARLGAILRAVERLPAERAVELRFDAFVLHLRLTGRSGGLWLLVDGVPVSAHDGPARELPAFAAHSSRDELPRFRAGAGPWGANEAAEAWFAAREREVADAARRARVLADARRAVARLRRRLDHLEEDLARAERAPQLREEADLLAAHLYRVRKGAAEVVLEDSEGRAVRIALDPGRSPAANLQAAYTRAKRLERAAAAATERRVQARASLQALVASLARAEDDPGELDALEASLPRARPRAPEPASVPWTRWVGPGGEEVLVGRNAAGNRRLTFQRARGSDWWMHLRDRPGAHLVLPMSPGRTPSLEHLLGAAQICLQAAAVPAGVAADVTYTRARDVRAIPGEAGGRVVLHGERVLRVTADPAVLGAWEPDG